MKFKVEGEFDVKDPNGLQLFFDRERELARRKEEARLLILEDQVLTRLESELAKLEKDKEALIEKRKALFGEETEETLLACADLNRSGIKAIEPEIDRLVAILDLGFVLGSPKDPEDIVEIKDEKEGDPLEGFSPEKLEDLPDVLVVEDFVSPPGNQPGLWQRLSEASVELTDLWR